MPLELHQRVGRLVNEDEEHGTIARVADQLGALAPHGRFEERAPTFLPTSNVEPWLPVERLGRFPLLGVEPAR